MMEAILKKSFGPISALADRFQSSKYLMYSSGLNLKAAALVADPARFLRGTKIYF
jgi:hypothetical protein